VSEKHHPNDPDPAEDRNVPGTSGDIGASEAEETGHPAWLLGWVKGPSRAIALAFLVVLLVLFGRDVLSSWHLQGEISRLRERRRELVDSLAADSILLRRLDDPVFLERYARERYLMRRAGEDVFILDE
jgi:cell division protein FtsB